MTCSECADHMVIPIPGRVARLIMSVAIGCNMTFQRAKALYIDAYHERGHNT